MIELKTINTILFLVVIVKAKLINRRLLDSKFIFLNQWKDYISYFWKDDEVNILDHQNKKDIKVRIDYKEKDTLNNFLNKETNLIETN